MIGIFQWRSSLEIREWRMMTLWGMIKDLNIHTHARAHTHTVPVPLFLSKSYQLASFVCYTSHRMPRHLGTFSPPFVSSFCSPSPCLSICFSFHPLTSSVSLPPFPHFLSSEKSVNCEFLPHYVVLWSQVSTGSFCGLGNCPWVLTFLSFVRLSVSLWEHVNCFWTPISVH